MLWMHKLRLRVFALIVAMIMLAFGVIGILSAPAFLVVGVAIPLAVTLVNTMASKLSVMTCAGCGTNIEQLPAGTHGIYCNNCGTVNHPYTNEKRLAHSESNDFDFADHDDSVEA